MKFYLIPSHIKPGKDEKAVFKTFVVDLTVAVDVGFSDHLVNLLVSQLLAQVGHHVSELGGRDKTVAVLKKN